MTKLAEVRKHVLIVSVAWVIILLFFFFPYIAGYYFIIWGKPWFWYLCYSTSLTTLAVLLRFVLLYLWPNTFNWYYYGGGCTFCLISWVSAFAFIVTGTILTAAIIGINKRILLKGRLTKSPSDKR